MYSFVSDGTRQEQITSGVGGYFVGPETYLPDPGYEADLTEEAILDELEDWIKVPNIHKADDLDDNTIVLIEQAGVHFSLCVNPKVFAFTRCGRCKKFLKNLEAHHPKCSMCERCWRAYNPLARDPHRCSEDRLISTRVLKRLDKHLRPTWDSLVAYADLETFTPPGSAYMQVYAAGLRIGGMTEVFKGPRSIIQFVDRLEDWMFHLRWIDPERTGPEDMLPEGFTGIVKGRQPPATLYFHNGGRFDLLFMMRAMFIREHKVDKLVLNGGSILRMDCFEKKLKVG